MSEKSLGGHLYYVTFIYDHYRKTWLYLLKTKDGVFDKFKEFRSEVKTLTKRKIKTLRFDNDGQYTYKELISYVRLQVLRGSSFLPTILRKMDWWKGRIG